MKKICNECGIEKSIEEFHIDNRAKDKHFSICKKCRSKGKEISQEEKERRKVNAKIAKNIWSNLSGQISRSIKLEPRKSFFEELVGCSMAFYLEYIGNKFEEDMNWQNYGKWEIDHIKAQSLFDLTNESEIKKCYHYTNTRPFWKGQNRRHQGVRTKIT